MPGAAESSSASPLPRPISLISTRYKTRGRAPPAAVFPKPKPNKRAFPSRALRFAMPALNDEDQLSGRCRRSSSPSRGLSPARSGRWLLLFPCLSIMLVYLEHMSRRHGSCRPRLCENVSHIARRGKQGVRSEGQPVSGGDSYLPALLREIMGGEFFRQPPGFSRFYTASARSGQSPLHSARMLTVIV